MSRDPLMELAVLKQKELRHERDQEALAKLARSAHSTVPRRDLRHAVARRLYAMAARLEAQPARVEARTNA
jgi:hypothetical protein